MNPSFLLPVDGQWVGPPLLKLQLSGRSAEILDGRRRFREYTARGLRTDIPVFIAKSHPVAIKQLILNGHAERAAMHAMAHYPQLVSFSTKTLDNILDVGRNKLQPFVRALKAPEERHKLPRRAMRVVIRAKKLHNKMLEGNDITIVDLEEMLGEFLE